LNVKLKVHLQLFQCVISVFYGQLEVVISDLIATDLFVWKTLTAN